MQPSCTDIKMGVNNVTTAAQVLGPSLDKIMKLYIFVDVLVYVYMCRNVYVYEYGCFMHVHMCTYCICLYFMTQCSAVRIPLVLHCAV